MEANQKDFFSFYLSHKFKINGNVLVVILYGIKYMPSL